MPNTNLPPTIKRIHPSIPFTIAIFVLLYLGLNAWIYFYGTAIFSFIPFLKNSAETVSVVKERGGCTIPTTKFKQLTNRSTTALPAGKQAWTFSHGPGVTGPDIQTVSVDPLTPSPCGSQTVTITAKYTSPITATVTRVTDNKQKSAPMKRTGGTDTNGTWVVTWTMDDTYDTIYHIDFVLKSATGDWSGALTFR